MVRNETSYHKVLHRNRDEMIVPYIAVQNNIDFMLNKGDRYLITSDNVKAKVAECKEVHICELEDDITRLYNMDTWAFIKRWYVADKRMDSMHFFKIKLSK